MLHDGGVATFDEVLQRVRAEVDKVDEKST